MLLAQCLPLPFHLLRCAPGQPRSHPASPVGVGFGNGLCHAGPLDWLLECDGPLDWDRRRSLDRDLARPLDEVLFRWPWERLLDRDLDLDRLLACCDESRLSTPVAAERLFELELRCAGWLTPSSALAGTVC
ncbi:hypothetical protein MRX96_052610 [Rhipicephalus microplus]